MISLSHLRDKYDYFRIYFYFFEEPFKNVISNGRLAVTCNFKIRIFLIDIKKGN